MAKITCCICDPNLPINPHVCARHKLEGLRLARAEGVYYSEIAGRLYLEARAGKKTTFTCGGCGEQTATFTKVDDLAIFCPACVAAGSIPWIKPNPLTLSPTPRAEQA